jgi:chromosome segregation ATPase
MPSETHRPIVPDDPETPANWACAGAKMGRSAHDASRGKGESRQVGELETLRAEIARLLDQAERDDDPARLERTLTDGYARALSLEAEGSRLRREIERLDASSERAELRALTSELEAQLDLLEQLRDELVRLRQRHSVAVRAVSD